MLSVNAPSPKLESVGSPKVKAPPEDAKPLTLSSTYFLVDASESAAGSPTCNFTNVAPPKSVCVDPSPVVVVPTKLK